MKSRKEIGCFARSNALPSTVESIDVCRQICLCWLFYLSFGVQVGSIVIVVIPHCLYVGYNIRV